MLLHLSCLFLDISYMLSVLGIEDVIHNVLLRNIVRFGKRGQAVDGMLSPSEDTENVFGFIPTILWYACCSQLDTSIKEASSLMIRLSSE